MTTLTYWHKLLKEANIETHEVKRIAIDCIAISCLFAIACEVVVVSQTEAEANSAKTMTASPTPRVTLG